MRKHDPARLALLETLRKAVQAAEAKAVTTKLELRFVSHAPR